MNITKAGMFSWWFFLKMGAFLGVTLILVYCSTQPECRTDRDCARLRGAEFVCFSLLCRNQNVVVQEQASGNEPGAEKTPDVATEPVREGGVEASPEKPGESPILPEPGPEPVQETKVESDPNQGSLPVGAPCEGHRLANVKDRCAPGLLCVKIDSLSSYCVQDCSADANVCRSNTDGRNTCLQIAWSPDETSKAIKACVSVAKKDELCDPQRSIFCERGSGTNHLICLKSKCTSGTLCASAGCSCSTQASPPVECDITKKLVCDYSTNLCIFGIRAYEGEVCNTYGNSSRFCDIDHQCVTYGGGTLPDLCLRLCDLKNPATSCTHHAPKSFKCIDVKGRGACIQDACAAQKECAFQTYPHQCLVQTTPSRSVSCSPLPYSGLLDFAQNCSGNSTDKSKSCMHPFQCVASYCSIQCRVDSDCQMLHPKAFCFLRNNTTGMMYCGFRCSDTCPSPLKCQQGESFCVGTPPTP